MTLLARIVRVSPYYPPTMDIVVNMPIVLTIPSCLAFLETDESIWIFLYDVIEAQREWNEHGGYVQHRGKKVHRMLRMEGFEDVTENKLRNDSNNRRNKQESERMDDEPSMELSDDMTGSQSIAEPMDGQAPPSLSDIVALLDSASIPHELQLKPTSTPKKGM
ncbi:hypothetical protein BLNAU_5108 [Blattamonas nauphoetae]|uniref:Uncharacterized protein n=1 Tax=Blattamonas nauphoetae TaxID=2049346 RepID=A0ABQ9Y841_9EUKA|nr:hypothetical protein BLNAU_5108 [Blattamonas nauphoetae]